MNRLCVYCGSRMGRDDRYRDATISFGRELVRRDIGLVYGGGGVGLMGVLAETVHRGGGEVIGVIPATLQEREKPPNTDIDLIIVDSMHARKQRMFDLAEGFAALAGGLGTLEELVEMLTWAQLGFHTYPCGVLNVNGYYDGFLSFIDGAVTAEFVPKEHRALLTVDTDPADLLSKLAAHPSDRDAHCDRDDS